MTLLKESGTEAWLNSLQEVMNLGTGVAPRGKDTKEILNQVIEFDMNYPVCHHPERKLSYQFMAAEAYWITSGSPLVEDISPYNKHIANFSDDGYIFNGAYGPAFISQLNHVVNSLKEDSNSRQAVITIWHPNPISSKDHKCTVSLIFNVRFNRIYTTVLMRSNDLQLGRPYDMFNFTVMTLKVLTELNRNKVYPVELGTCTLHAVSAHVYEPWYEKSQRMLHQCIVIPYDRVPAHCITDWQFVVDSLLACRDKTDTSGLWEIRPNENSNS